MENFNKEAFIEEVEKRPVIWNTECPEYSDRILKKKAWNELTDVFADPTFSKEKKSIFCMILQRKWKNLKDTYMKEYKKLKSNPVPSYQKGSSYMYYSKLSFLQKSLQTKPTPSSTTQSGDNQSMDVDPTVKATELLASMNDSIVELMETASSLEKSTNRLKSSEPHSSPSSSTSLPYDTRKSPRTLWKGAIPIYSEKLLKSRFDGSGYGHFEESKKKSSSKRHEDDDKLFCLSLYKEIRKVPENNRLAAKIELLNVLQKAQMLPMNDMRMAFQHAPINPAPQWFNVNYPKPFTVGEPNVPVASTTPESISSYLMELRGVKDYLAEQSKSERHVTRLASSPFQEQSNVLGVNSPVSSLESSLSSNCSLHHFVDP